MTSKYALEVYVEDRGDHFAAIIAPRQCYWVAYADSRDEALDRACLILEGAKKDIDDYGDEDFDTYMRRKGIFAVDGISGYGKPVREGDFYALAEVGDTGRTAAK